MLPSASRSLLHGESLARNRISPSPTEPLKSGFSSIFSIVPFQFCNHSWQYTIYGLPSSSTQNVPSRVGMSAGKYVASAIGLYGPSGRSEEHTSELQSLMRISYAVFCL